MSALMELPTLETRNDFNLRRWAELQEDPMVRNLVGRVETDRFGKILMSPPPAFDHGSYQFRIGLVLERYLRTGRVTVETPISTSEGVRLADAAWASDDFLAALPAGCVCLPTAPEICVEIVSPSNTREEMQEKRRLYFEAGAREFWLCHEGNLSFYLADAEPPAERSALCPDFPARVEL